jgi:hypothetical protein
MSTLPFALVFSPALCVMALATDTLPRDTILHLDPAKEIPGLRLMHGAKRNASLSGGVLEFTSALQYAEIDFAKRLDGVKAASIGTWVYLRRAGEGTFFSRGMPEIAPLGERRFAPAKDWVSFFLGTEQHGFLVGSLNGNGEMPFPLVTLDELRINSWHQIVLVKDVDGGQKFYHNGMLTHSDADSCWAGKVWPFADTVDGEPLRFAIAQGGLMGEVWVAGRAVSADEVRAEFGAKKSRYSPALPAVPVQLRRMNAHSQAGLWRKPITKGNWPAERERILAGVRQVLGPFPEDIMPLEPQVHGEEDCGSYLRRKVSIRVQPGDRMPAWLLIPKTIKGRVPAIICFYGTTSGAGKDTTVGLSGPKPGTPPHKNRAFAVDMVEAGFVALAPDYLRDGERLPPSGRPYDSTDFYKRFPNWSCVGKDVWDNMRAIDYLQTLSFVDPERIGMVGHSYGGHSTIFAAALEPRIKAAFASGPVSDFLRHGIHWGVPRGAGGSASLPGLRPYVLSSGVIRRCSRSRPRPRSIPSSARR